jgi:hypothetical protein
VREEQEFQAWTQEQDDRLRGSLGALRHDVDTAGIPDVRFVMRRAGRQRHRAVAGVAAGAAAVLGLSWVGYQSLDNGASTAPPAGTGSVTTERDRSEAPSTDRSATDAALVDPADLVLAESGGPDLHLFVPPTLWASPTFTAGAETEAGMGEFESTALFDCDPDDVMWGSPQEGTFGLMGVWSGGTAFGTQRVRVLDSADAATGYVNELDAALADCTAPADADNIILNVDPLELSGAYRITTEFRDGTDPITDFVYAVQHDGAPAAVSTFRITDWSAAATDAEAVAELERLAGLARDN